MSEEQGEVSQEGKTEGKQIPPECPVPPEHVQLYQECCEKYQAGEMTDLDVMMEVVKTLKGLRSQKTE